MIKNFFTLASVQFKMSVSENSESLFCRVGKLIYFSRSGLLFFFFFRCSVGPKTNFGILGLLVFKWIIEPRHNSIERHFYDKSAVSNGTHVIEFFLIFLIAETILRSS